MFLAFFSITPITTLTVVDRGSSLLPIIKSGWFKKKKHRANSCDKLVPALWECMPADSWSILEYIGIFSHNFKNQVPNDVPSYGQIIPNTNMRSQGYIEDISKWKKTNRCYFLRKKTKSMIGNFTENFQFHTRLKLNNSNIQVVEKMKILGTNFYEQAFLEWQLWQFSLKS